MAETFSNNAFQCQKNWFALVDAMGEPAARAHLVERLRWAANQIESKSFPDVFGCDLDTARVLPTTTICVVLSDVWPG